MPIPTFDELLGSVQAAFKAWHKGQPLVAPQLRQLRLVANQRKFATEKSSPAPAEWQIIQEVVLAALAEVGKGDEMLQKVVHLHFVELYTAKEIAHKLKLNNRDKVNRLQTQALAGVAQVLLQQETIAQQEHMAALDARLPPRQYIQLFGIEALQKQGWIQLTKPDEMWIVALVGLGGIGKTALADALARQAIETGPFTQVFWVRANYQPQASATSISDQVLAALADVLWPHSAEIVQPQERLRRLRQALQTQPHLIVIDNLEMLTDLTELLGHLSQLTNPSKFLLTTRARPTGQYPVFVLGLDELPQPDAYALMRHLASSSGNVELAAAQDEHLMTIYQTVGGNPLALRLVVSLAAVQPLPDVLAGLATSRAGSIENLYRHVYWQAWQALNEPARTLLQAMPLVAEVGGLPEQLQHISGLPENIFWGALEELTARSLIETRGGLTQRRYGIHRLTDTFLRTEIIYWPDDAEL